MSVGIRIAAEQDIPQLSHLMMQYIVDFYQRKRPDEEALLQFIRNIQSNPSSGLQFVAEQEGKFLGFATLYFTFSTLQVKKAAILNDLFVMPHARGKKIGERLFEACLSYIRENDFAYMTWETAKDNHRAQSLYDKMGGSVSDWLVYEIQ